MLINASVWMDLKSASENFFSNTIKEWTEFQLNQLLLNVNASNFAAY